MGDEADYLTDGSDYVENFWDEEYAEQVEKCLICNNSFRRKNNPNTIYCRLKRGQCNFVITKPKS